MSSGLLARRSFREDYSRSGEDPFHAVLIPSSIRLRLKIAVAAQVVSENFFQITLLLGGKIVLEPIVGVL